MNRVRRFPGQSPYNPKFTRKSTKYPLKVMIWGCFNHACSGSIKVCEGTMNQNSYLDTLSEKLLPTISQYGLEGRCYHLDDSAKCHRTKKILDWHCENNIMKIDWPGNSPDLNPIENLWAILKYKLRCRTILTKATLIHEIKKVWFEEIDKNIFQNLSNFMPSRIQKVLDNKGYPSKY